MIPDKAFYVDPKNVNDSTFFLNKEESHHITKVFRLVPGSKISLLNGIGLGYHATIVSIHEGIVSGTIENKIESFGENKIHINIAPSIIKRDRFESLLEKVTELGVKEIYPLITGIQLVSYCLETSSPSLCFFLSVLKSASSS